MPSDRPAIVHTAMAILHHAHKTTGEDPRVTFVICMTAAAMSGHMIARTREQLHEMLDQVADVAEAAVLHVTETPQ